MPLFPGPSPVAPSPDRETRTNNKLFLNDLEATGDRWLTDPRLPNQFLYHYAGDDGNYVVIPKGRVVSLVPGGYRVRAFPSGKEYPALTIANGGQDVVEPDQQEIDKGNASATYTRVANVPVGIADRNIFKRIDDTFHGNEPYFRRYGYIELPHIVDTEAAAEMKWGAVAGPIDVTDFVKPNERGHLVRWDPDNDPITQRVGQVLFIDHNVPPEGWLEWVKGGDLDAAVRSRLPYMQGARDAKLGGFRPEDLLANQGYPFDPAYRNQDYWAPTGIPGLTDGSRLVTTFNDEKIGVIPDSAQAGDIFYFRVEHRPVVPGTLTLKIGGVTASADYVDAASGLVVVRVPLSQDATPVPVTGEVLATYNATGQVGGWPTHWDFKGSVGAVRIALCFA